MFGTRVHTPVIAGVAAALLCSSAIAAPQQEDPGDGPGDGLEELAGDGVVRPAGAPGGAGMSREQVKLAAETIAARAPGSVDDFKALQAKVEATAARVRPAVVAILFSQGERKGAGSGTLISPDGWVLTAAHVCRKPGIPVTIFLADGTELSGRTAGQHMDKNQDVGLIKVDTGGKALPYLEIGSTDALTEGEPILVLGHPLGPEVKPWRPPPLRVGHVLAKSDGVLCMDAPVTPGDSGGPVVNLKGQIVGITSVASYRPDVNAAVSADFARSKVDALKQDVATGAGLATDDESQVWVTPMEGFAPLARESQNLRAQRQREALSPLVFDATSSVVTVMVDARDAALGVVVDEAGHILTKASEVGTGVRSVQVAMPDGSTVRAKRVAQDERLDLMLLSTDTQENQPIKFDTAEPSLGGAVVSVGKGMAPAAVGFRSLEAYDAGASDQASRSLIGVALRQPEPADHLTVPGVIVTKVLDGSAAKEAGLREGDALLVVDGVELTSADAPSNMLRAHAPGDTIEVEYMRAGIRKKLSIRLQQSPFEFGPGSFGAEISRRNTGFGPVIQHDSIVPASQMGAPLMDLEGRVVGLNIAHAERCKTYALPSSVVVPALAKLLAAAEQGASIEPKDLRTVMPAVKFREDGTAVLVAGGAKVSGPTVTLEGVDDFQSLAGWSSVEDEALWVLDIPAPGRYEFKIDAQGLIGGRVDLYAGEELFTVDIAQSVGGVDYKAQLAGEAYFDEAGAIIVRLQPLDRPRGPIMKLREVRASRLDVVRMLERALPLLRLRDMDRLSRDVARHDQRARARKANEAAHKKLEEDAKKEEAGKTPDKTPDGTPSESPSETPDAAGAP